MSTTRDRWALSRRSSFPLPRSLPIASIVPITSAAVRDHGLKVDIEAAQHDMDGLVQQYENVTEQPEPTND